MNKESESEQYRVNKFTAYNGVQLPSSNIANMLLFFAVGFSLLMVFRGIRINGVLLSLGFIIPSKLAEN